MEIHIENKSSESRFIALSPDNEIVGEVLYIERGEYLDIFHTEVHEGYEGLGISSKMAKLVLEEIRNKNLKVFPRCPFLSGWLEKHTEFSDLIYK